ncbi:hypothetical protein [Paracoccus aminophilus]|uniref:Flagellar basal body-associated protein FliL n=1 Tax=Paracoccus aminophilus JCM 7686 TaxID=1367847 RepID=S5XXW1_PARAH|nr:hypothetical protein [Paracoccus aminophilus]AGT10132.1 flagellar basal body-associated protein FliL [Paracoccus aminophilus JCM 7686]
MIRKILMLVLPLLAFLGGAVGGNILHDKSKPAESVFAEGEEGEGEGHAKGKDAKPEATEMGYFRFPTQFFVPIIRNGDVSGTMILAVTLEVPKPAQEKVYGAEYRLRDALLGALMIHANTGGFDGNFTADAQMDRLKAALLKAAQAADAPDVSRVLVEDIAFQPLPG